MPRGIYLRKPKPLAERFWAKVDIRPGECWLWTGAISPDTGYGKIMLDDQRVVGAHAALWLLVHGELPPVGLDVRHSCHNRACVSPAHLSLGSRAQNMQDMVEAGRSNYHERNPNAKLTYDQVQLARASGLGATRLAREFGVSERTMRQALAGETWRPERLAEEASRQEREVELFDRLFRIKIETGGRQT